MSGIPSAPFGRRLAGLLKRSRSNETVETPHAEGSLPVEFDGLVLESLAGIIEREPKAARS